MLVGDAVIWAVGIGAGGAVTVTVAADVAEPVELLATSVYVVVALGDTVCEPVAATGDPFNVIAVAFDVVHESVEDWPV